MIVFVNASMIQYKFLKKWLPVIPFVQLDLRWTYIFIDLPLEWIIWKKLATTYFRAEIFQCQIILSELSSEPLTFHSYNDYQMSILIQSKMICYLTSKIFFLFFYRTPQMNWHSFEWGVGDMRSWLHQIVNSYLLSYRILQTNFTVQKSSISLEKGAFKTTKTERENLDPTSYYIDHYPTLFDARNYATYEMSFKYWHNTNIINKYYGGSQNQMFCTGRTHWVQLD